MIRAGSLFITFALFLAATAAEAAPVRLARTPDFHAGKIAFSYLGDIWVVNEDGTNPRRLTDNVARDINPRFSPDGKWIAFSSQRFGNYDVFVIPADGGTARRLTFHSGNEEVVGWTPDSKQVVFRASRGDGAFPGVATLYQVPVEGGRETSLPTDWGWWGSYSADGKRFAFNRHPSSWTRKHYRGSYAADIWVANLAAKTATPVLAGAGYNRYWPMFAGKNEIYFVGDPLPDDKHVKPGSLAVRRSLNNIYKVSLKADAQPVQVTNHSSGNVFYPSLSSDGKVIVYEADFGLWKLDVASGKSTEVKIDITTEEKENQVETIAIENEADGFDISPSGKRAVISARNQIFTVATDKGDISTIANDIGASRNESPAWSPDGKHIAFVSDRSGRQEVYLVDPNGKNLKQISDLDTDKSSIVWAPDSKSLIFASSDKKLYLFSVADGKTRVLTSSTLAQPWGPAFSPDSKWVSFLKQDETLRNHVYILALKGGPERRITDDDRSFSEGNAVWSGDGRFLAYTIQAGTGGGVASTGGRAANETKLMALPLRALNKDPFNKDIDSEADAVRARRLRPRHARWRWRDSRWRAWRRPRRGFRACGGQNRLEGPDQAGSADRGCGRHDRGLEGRAHRQRHRLHGGLGHVYRESGGKRRACPRTLRPVEHLRQPWPGSRRLSQRQRHGLYQGRPLPLFPLWRRHLRGIRGRRWPGGRRARGFRSHARPWPPRFRSGPGRARCLLRWADGAASDLHHPHGTGSPRPAQGSFSGGLAGHEESLLRRQDARCRLECGQEHLRRGARQSGGSGRTAQRLDDDDR